VTATCEADLAAGLAAHRKGRLDEAERIYGTVLEKQPENPAAWHLLGHVALERKQFREAAARVMQAIHRRPDQAEFHVTLGDILAAQGRHADAVLCYQEALRLQPGNAAALVNLGNAYSVRKLYRQACSAFLRAIQAHSSCPEAFNNLGNALRAQGAAREAMECYSEALRLRPGDPGPAVNMAAACLDLQRYREAERWARKALRAQPGFAQALSNLSIALRRQERGEEAERWARRAIAASPEAALMHANLGALLVQQKRFAEAETVCRHALELQPGLAEAATDLGLALQGLGRIEEADAQFELASRRRPDYAEPWANRGALRDVEGRPAEALAYFDEALRRDPSHGKAHLGRAWNLLREGRFAEGFAEYEWRWKVTAPPAAVLERPPWRGEPLNGRTILLYSEQGLGDTLQFVRFAPLVAARGGRVIVSCQPAVAELVRSVGGVADVARRGDALPGFDVQAALLSLPGILGTTPQTIPAAVPYIVAAPEAVARMRERLRPAGFRAGLAWFGNPAHPGDAGRSMALETLAPLRAVPGVDWYSLHIGERARKEIRRQGAWLGEVLGEGVPDLAALIQCLDLVITVDSMPAHLAGALGRPVWTLLARVADWRWFRSGETTPWYPTMRLFRQQRPGDWGAVVEQLARELRALAAQASLGSADMQN